MVVNLDHPRQLFRTEHVPQIRRTERGDILGYNDTRQTLESRYELVVEDILSHGDRNRSSQPLAEENNRHTRWDILFGEDRLGGNVGLLEAEADTKPVYNLKAYPFGMGSSWREQCDQARRDRRQNGTQEDGWVIITDPSDKDPCHDGRHDQTENEGERREAGSDCRVALDCLEPYGEVVDDDHKRRTKEEGVQCAGRDGSLLHDAWRDGRRLLAPDLDADKRDEQYTEDDEEGDDSAVGPCVLLTTPLKSEEETDDARHENQGTRNVDAL